MPHKITKIERSICTSEADYEFIKEFEDQLQNLCGIVIETFEQHPQYLLSPNLRKLVAEKAKLVEAMHKEMYHKLCCDNLNEDLTITH